MVKECVIQIKNNSSMHFRSYNEKTNPKHRKSVIAVIAEQSN